MSDLQTAYYVIAIVFMVVVFLMVIAVLAAVLVIRAKINVIHDRIEEKVELAVGLAEKSGAMLGGLRKVISKSKK